MATESPHAPARRARYTAAVCDLCGPAAATLPLGMREVPVRQRRTLFHWRISDAVCARCGLARAAEVPDDDFLADYYAEAHTPRSTVVDIEDGFDAEARLVTLRRFAPGRDVLEFGAGHGGFCRFLEKAGFRARGIDPVQAADRRVVTDPASTNLADVTADVVVAYHALEHLPRPGLWLRNARKWIRPEGTILLEVPDVVLWPFDAWHHEHMVQYSPEHLAALAEAEGYITLSLAEERPSRPHGFVYVGRWSGAPNRDRHARLRIQAHALVARTQGLYARLAEIDRRQRVCAEDVARRVVAAQAGKPTGEVVCWGANEIATMVGRALEGRNAWPVRIFDSADTKVGGPHPGFENAVERPKLDSDDTNRHIFVLCTRNHNGAIAATIRTALGSKTAIVEVEQWPHR